MTTVWRSLWREPRSADPPRTGRSDWLLVCAYVAAVGVEALARPDVTWRPFVTLVALAIVPALLWRRTRPLAATLAGWGAAGLLSVLQLTTDGGDLGLRSMLAVLVLLYALVRWGSGPEILAGTAFVMAVVALGLYAATAGPGDVFGSSVLLLLVGALAAVFRSRADLWRRRQHEIRTEERVALARELHDTVAHHVSAIAVLAQAGGVVAGSRPDKAGELLGVIEAEASRTLAEMRSMVRVLRTDGGVEYSPQPGLADVAALARTRATPRVEVAVDPALPPLSRQVETALYRIAQESLTNALRHARGATRVAIDVRREGGTVRLRVRDDGRTEHGSPSQPGFGLLGMAERVELLGGSFAAGPEPTAGWVVDAVLGIEGPS